MNEKNDGKGRTTGGGSKWNEKLRERERASERDIESSERKRGWFIYFWDKIYNMFFRGGYLYGKDLSSLCLYWFLSSHFLGLFLSLSHSCLYNFFPSYLMLRSHSLTRKHGGKIGQRKREKERKETEPTKGKRAAIFMTPWLMILQGGRSVVSNSDLSLFLHLFPFSSLQIHNGGRRKKKTVHQEQQSLLHLW